MRGDVPRFAGPARLVEVPEDRVDVLAEPAGELPDPVGGHADRVGVQVGKIGKATRAPQSPRLSAPSLSFPTQQASRLQLLFQFLCQPLGLLFHPINLVAGGTIFQHFECVLVRPLLGQRLKRGAANLLVVILDGPPGE